MLMEHRDDSGRFGEVLLDLDAPDTIQFQLKGARRRMSWRQFVVALGLHTGEEMESPSFTRFLGTSPSYNLIRDLNPNTIQAPRQPPPPPATARTMPQRMAILEENVYEIRRVLAEQNEVIGAMARDFSRFIVWAASSIAQILDSA
ncbi:hypothetical protein Tco_0857866 [Tanacetum coccineum]|uniref:Uncharacterized protein n=1 Tax=Tanacetum coccineum TaxID=301880 RepID=A0ABQ5BD67_9ASTR